MDARFLIGPAGSGKTFRCLGEIRVALRESPDGPPLLLLAPKQATFQLERQLLADPSLTGYTRLHILSFERLADFVLERLAAAPPRLLDDEGRVMVLRALLAKREKELQLFHSTARLPGFARQLSQVLREIQQNQLSPKRLRSLAEKAGAARQLKEKLSDMALVLEAYQDWLGQHQLEDANSLLDLAAGRLVEAARKQDRPPALFAGLWLDGFAEMTPQELGLLAALMPFCERATLAFCLEEMPRDDVSWLSTWSVVSQTFRRCHQNLSAIPGINVAIETLGRDAAKNRYSANPALAHLERHWTSGLTCPEPANSKEALRIAVCSQPESEAILAAREILRHVRNGGRYRDIAVLMRQLDNHHEPLRRVFTRYGIPFFLDRRESVSHHPLAELTRYSLRLLAYGWRREDLFGALKTGLVPASEQEIDALENQALAMGWDGRAWTEGLPAHKTDRWENLRQRLVPPFLELGEQLGETPGGRKLAGALLDFWKRLKAGDKLQQWSDAAEKDGSQAVTGAVHLTVWQQMQGWLESVAMAFENERLPLREWLPILEAGLSGLSVGVIPPALDQVLVGTVDRSRNPDLQLAIILGLNESLFPAKPSPSVLLTDADRQALEGQNVFLGPNTRQRLGHERYFGYIACTRARRRLVLACSRADAKGTALNPSPFVDHVKRLFPGIQIENVPASPDWPEAEHASELIRPLLLNRHADEMADPSLKSLEELPVFAPVLEKHEQLSLSRGKAALSPASVEKLYGTELVASVSGLEAFAACPFKFFVGRGLRAEERQEFEVGHREKGSFQHEVLNHFHRELQAEGRLWRELTPAEARDRIRTIGESLLPVFRDGLLIADERGRFTAGVLIEGLQQLMETLIGWMPHYQFDPKLVELGFGGENDPLPPWKLDLGSGHALMLRGRIDRVDICPAGEGKALAAVIDYKSSRRDLDKTKLYHGLELQLLAYLGVLRHLADPKGVFDADSLLPAGVFYVALKGGGGSTKTRTEAIEQNADDARAAYQHLGRFDGGYLGNFDNRGVSKGDQFRFSFNKDGQPASRGNDALPSDEFRQLLDDIEAHLKRIGTAIFDGDVAVSPYRKGKEIACDRCEYRSICRFDPWLDHYRVLTPPPKPEKAEAERKRKAQGKNS